MAGFTQRQGKIAVLSLDHIDTDRIVPARYLQWVTKMGYGEVLFHDVRGEGFPLDAPEAKGAEILVVGTNFGCGSSREHAVWAIQQAGFFAVISRIEENSPGFSDIFRQNAANCGLLLVELGREDHEALASLGTGAVASVDLPAQTVEFGQSRASFEIAPAVKEQLLAGRDLIGTTLLLADSIEQFEKEHDAFAPTPIAR